MSVSKQSLRLLGYLESSSTAFLACDIQEVFRKPMKNFDTMVKVANRMAAGAAILNIPLYVSEQYPEKLGPSASDFDKGNATLLYDKTQFSMLTDKLLTDIKKRFPNKLESVVIFGLETHVCVEQTAMDFMRQDIGVHVLADGCISRTQTDRIIALQRLRTMGCHITTSESILFKLMKDKAHPKFREISRLVRDPIPDNLGLEAIPISKM